MCDVEDSESTSDGGKFFHVLILMCDYGKLLVLLLLSKFTHTHTLPSEVLKPSKICTLTFCNTPLYSLDILHPECLLLGFVSDAF